MHRNISVLQKRFGSIKRNKMEQYLKKRRNKQTPISSGFRKIIKTSINDNFEQTVYIKYGHFENGNISKWTFKIAVKINYIIIWSIYLIKIIYLFFR